MRCLNRAEVTFFKKQNKITVVNHASCATLLYPTDLPVKSPTKQTATRLGRNWKHFSTTVPCPSVWYNDLYIITEKVNSRQLI